MKTLFPLLFTLLVCSCKQTSNETTGLVVVDVAKDYPAKEVFLQDIADVEYIPMATTDTTLVNGRPSYVSKEGIVARGGKVGEILIFDPKGQNLQGRICRRGQGPEEYNAIIFNIVDWKRKEVFIADYTSLKVYDFAGNYLRTLLEEDIMTMNIRDLDENNLLCAKDKGGSETPYHPYFLLSKKDGKADTLDIEIPYFIASNRKILWDDGHTSEAYGYLPLLFSNIDKIWLTSLALDTVFQIQPDHTLKPEMIPLYAPTKDKEAPLLHFLGMNDQYAWISRKPRHVTVRMNDMNAGMREEEKVYMYDRTNREWFEPIYRNRAFKNRNLDPKVIQLVSVPYGYGLIELNVMDLIEAYQKNELIDEQLKKIASTLKEEDNPVLMLLRFKESLR